MQIYLYQYNGDVRVINKTLPKPMILEGQINVPLNVLRPHITIRQKDGYNYNYCMIPDLNRCYYINDIINIGNNDYELYLDCDVLKTWSLEITKATATAIRGSEVNNYISNRDKIYNVQPNLQKIDFPTKNLLNAEGSIIMVTIKGNDK